MQYIQRSSAADERQLLDYEKIFGNDNGEDETPEILAAYFVENQAFRKAFDKTRKLEIVKAKKGMGKSALLSHLQFLLSDKTKPLDSDAIVIKITGNALIGLADFTGLDSAQIENRWRQVICKRISMEIALEIGFASSDTSMALIEAAEIEGFKGRNLVSGLMSRIGTTISAGIKAATAGSINLDNKIPTDSKNLGYENILHRIQKSKDRNVWILIDDIDAKFVDTPEMQIRIGAFFSAIRSLAFSVEGLKVRASVRTDVWSNLRRMEDQDKIRQYVTEIKWSDDQLRNIFAKKILSYLQRDRDERYANLNEHDNYQKIITEVFSGDFRIGAEKKGDPLSIAMHLGGKRPRWMGQLCKQAGGAAGTMLIQQRHFNAVMSSFGQEKISDLIKEHNHQFNDLQKVIDAFRSTDKTNSRFKVISIIERGYTTKISSEKIPPINGFPFKETSQIAELLYEIDFIIGEKDHKHTPFYEDPTLFKCEVNQQNKIPWLVNVSYRSFLGIQ